MLAHIFASFAIFNARNSARNKLTSVFQMCTLVHIVSVCFVADYAKGAKIIINCLNALAVVAEV